MIQDIKPHIFSNNYKVKSPEDRDYIVAIYDKKILARLGNESTLPTFNEYKECLNENVTFLFGMDDADVYLYEEKVEEKNDYIYVDINKVRDIRPMYVAFSLSVALQIYEFYKKNRFCGCCGSKTHMSTKERAVVCTSCNNIVYPAIAPSVIVAVTNGDKLLLTKYARGSYKKYALVAGYTEVGETLEETVAREVMEEVGLRVKNIEYYKSQPWPFSGTLLAGFYAEVDGSDIVHLDEEELCEGTWYSREDIPATDSDISLTSEMIEKFRKE